MSPIGHIQWRGKFTTIEVPIDLYFSKWRNTCYNIAASPLVPVFTPFYFLATHLRRRRLNEDLCRNELFPNTKGFFYKGIGNTSL